jgi:MurNAc alpha-1-phosphate uridylyltransferase
MPKIPQAMILAAGFGSRLKSITMSCPKPLLDIGGMPIIDHTLQHLREIKIKKCVVNTHYLSKLMQAHLQRVNNPEIIVSHEDEILETGGGLLKALPNFDNQPFFAINGDIWWQNGTFTLLERMMATWDDAKHDVLLALCPIKNALGYNSSGDYNIREDGLLARNKNKPVDSVPFVYGGIQIIHPRIFDGVLERNGLKPFSVVQIFDKAEAAGRLSGLVHDGIWSDIGTPESLAMTRELIKSRFNQVQKA